MGKVVDVQKKVDKFFDLFDELLQLNTESATQQAEIDKKLSALYHKIEGMELKNATQSHSIIKELKGVLHKRRDIKKNVAITTSLVSMMQPNVVGANKKYKIVLQKHADLLEEIKNRAK